jgi:hypothetical protein
MAVALVTGASSGIELVRSVRGRGRLGFLTERLLISTTATKDLSKFYLKQRNIFWRLLPEVERCRNGSARSRPCGSAGLFTGQRI